MDSPAAPIHLVVWRSTTVDSGGLCVMMAGTPQILVSLVANLGCLLPPPAGPQVVLEGEIFTDKTVTFTKTVVHINVHNLFYVIVVPWASRVYGICTLSVVICIPEGEARGNTYNYTKGTNPYTRRSPWYS